MALAPRVSSDLRKSTPSFLKLSHWSGNVRLGSKADKTLDDVRFTPKSEHQSSHMSGLNMSY